MSPLLHQNGRDFCSTSKERREKKRRKKKKKKEEPAVKPPRKEEKGLSKCAGYLGYLAGFPKNKPILQECLTYPKVLDCVMKKVTLNKTNLSWLRLLFLGDRSPLSIAPRPWAVDRKLILVLTDDDIEKIIEKSSGRNPEIIIRQRIEDFRLSL